MTQVTDAVDEKWRPVAEAARECMQLLGYPVTMLRCMPGEDQAADCFGGVAMHAGSYLAVLKAIIDHQLLHLKMPQAEFDRIYQHAQAEFDCRH